LYTSEAPTIQHDCCIPSVYAYCITGDGSTLIIICRRGHWPGPD